MCFLVVIKWTKTFGWRLKQIWAKLCTCNIYIKYHYYFTNCKCAWNNWYCKMISFITEWCATLNLFLQIGLRPIAILTFSSFSVVVFLTGGPILYTYGVVSQHRNVYERALHMPKAELIMMNTAGVAFPPQTRKYIKLHVTS